MKTILRTLGPLALLALALLASCSPQKKVWYLQNAFPYSSEQISAKGQIRIKPFDRLTVVINSKDPELAVPFNAWSSYSSLTGSPMGPTGQALQTRTVDELGEIELPVIGRIDCLGKTRAELARTIAEKIIEGGYINDPDVNVQFANLKIAVIGEVNRPGSFDIQRDQVSIFDALALAGDMTIYGVRDEVLVTREIDGVRSIEVLDLTSKDVFDSPAFYLQQNDVVYVKPNKRKAQVSTIDQNRTFYLSLVSTAISVTTLILTLTKK